MVNRNRKEQIELYCLGTLKICWSHRLLFSLSFHTGLSQINNLCNILSQSFKQPHGNWHLNHYCIKVIFCGCNLWILYFSLSKWCVRKLEMGEKNLLLDSCHARETLWHHTGVNNKINDGWISLHVMPVCLSAMRMHIMCLYTFISLHSWSAGHRLVSLSQSLSYVKWNMWNVWGESLRLQICILYCFIRVNHNKHER